MPVNLPKPVWNCLALFFLTWVGVAAWILIGGDTSASVRLAFVVCGSVGLYAGSLGGLFYSINKYFACSGIGKSFLRVSAGWYIALAVVGLIACILIPVFQQAHSYAAYPSVCSSLKQEGLQLLMYANDNDGVLPLDTSNRGIYRSILMINPYREESDPLSGRPFVWCNSLSGLRLSDIQSRDKVVVAYTSRMVWRRCTVLYLDGHVKGYLSRDKLNLLLRRRPALLAHAIRAKAKRDAAPTTKKAALKP